jgi:hypothetical protein
MVLMIRDITDRSTPHCQIIKLPNHQIVLYCYRRLYPRMRLIVLQYEIIERKAENITHRRVEFHSGQGIGRACQLKLYLFQVIIVNMHIPKRVDELTGLQSTDLCHHHRQQGIGCDIERNPQEYIGGALIELAAQFSIGHIKLEHGMTGHERHFRQIGHIPGADDQPPAIGILLYLCNEIADLIDHLSIFSFPASPLLAIDGTEIAIGVGPFIPDPDAVFFQVGDIGLALEEPKQLIDDAFHVNLLGSHERKPLLQVKAHLVAETALRSRTCSVRFMGTRVKDMMKEIEVLLHRRKLIKRDESTP